MMDRVKGGVFTPPFLFAAKILVVAVAGVLIFNLQRHFEPQKRHTYFVLPAEITSHLVLGFKILAADLIWLRFIQDIEYKESDVVSLGWGYQMLDSITTMDRRNRLAYVLGGTALSLFVNDTEGARRIFERGVEVYPNDWPMLYRTAYHYLYAINDCTRAAEYMTRVAHAGGPSWTVSLASSLYTHEGQKALGRSILEDAITRFEGQEVEKTLQSKLQNLDKKETGSGFEKMNLCKKK